MSVRSDLSGSDAGIALPLRIGISMRALFDLEGDHAIFEERGLAAYLDHQREAETVLPGKGAGFEAIARLLELNLPDRPAFVEVVLVSRNAPDMALRAFAAIKHHGLAISTCSFTGGAEVAPFLRAWRLDLFLSNDPVDVAAASRAGIAAGILAACPAARAHARNDDGGLRIAFDGDCVLFGEDSDRIYDRHGLTAFLRHEVERARTPMEHGPFRPILGKLSAVRTARAAAGSLDMVRTALVTSRCAPAHARVIHTLRAWGLEVDEAHFVGADAKGLLLAAFDAHVFFDDRDAHVADASRLVPSARVPTHRDGAHLLRPV